VLLLAKAGANLEFKHKDSGYTPLMMAAVGGSVKCVRVLLDHGADVMAVDNSGRTAKVV
jgi:ankyrin repeat protein